MPDQPQPPTPYVSGSPIAGVFGHFGRMLMEDSKRRTDEAYSARQQLADFYKKASEDKRYDTQHQGIAQQRYLMIAMHPHDKKLPKELDQEGLKDFLWSAETKASMKNGPSPIDEPKQPGDPNRARQTPNAEVMAPPPIDDQQGPGSLVPPMPGGDHFGGNQISPAPGIGGMTLPAPPPRDMDLLPPRPGAGAPPPFAGEMPPDSHSSMMSPEDQAHHARAVEEISKGLIPADAQMAEDLHIPVGTMISPQDAMLRYQNLEQRKTQAMISGIDIDTGALLPWKQKMNAATEELKSAQAEAQKLLAAGHANDAVAVLTKANAAMLDAQAHMYQAHNPSQSRMVTVIPTMDAEGRLTGSLGVPKTLGFTAAPTGLPEGSRRTAVGTEERKSAANIGDMLDREIPNIRTWAEHLKDWIGPLAGKAMNTGVNWISTLDPDAYQLVTAAKNITAERIYEMSGKQINEAEAKRLADVLSRVDTPYPKFLAALDQLEQKLRAIRAGNATPDKDKAADTATRVPGVTKKHFTSGPHAGHDGVWNGQGWEIQ